MAVVHSDNEPKDAVRFILDAFQSRRIESFRIDEMLTRCPIEHSNYLVIICAAIALFVAPHACIRM